MPEGLEVVARKAFCYGGTDMAIGEVFRLKGLLNDQSLLTFHVRAVQPNEETVSCVECQRQFCSETALNMHVQQEHPPEADPPRV